MNIIIYCLALHAPNMNKKLIKITYKVSYLPTQLQKVCWSPNRQVSCKPKE